MKKLFALVLMSIGFAPNSYAACVACCDAPAWFGVESLVALALYDGASGGTPLVRVLREVQATDSINTSKIRETIETSAEQLRNGEIAYGQQEQQLKMGRNALQAFPDVTQSACDEWVLRNSTQKDLANQEVLAQKGADQGDLDSNRDWGIHTKKNKDFFLSSPLNLSGGGISRPGCKPVFDPAVTAFETKKPVPVGWDCSEINKTFSSRTIPKDRVASTQILLNNMIQPEPLPQLPIGDRKTPAGQVYEVQSNKYKEGIGLVRDAAQHILSEFFPVVETKKIKTIYERYGLEPPKDDYISPMDDMHARAMMRFDNTHFREEAFRMPTKNVLLAYHQSQISKLNMTFKIYERELRDFRARVTVLAGVDSVEFDARK